jgi:hypothetical protein
MPVTRSCPVRHRLGINRVRGGGGVERRDAHAARVWLPLGHPSWELFCAAEFGISRAQAYRLPAAAAALDYGLSQRALIAVSSRSSDVAEPDHPPPRHARPQRPPAPR